MSRGITNCSRFSAPPLLDMVPTALGQDSYILGCPGKTDSREANTKFVGANFEVVPSFDQFPVVLIEVSPIRSIKPTIDLIHHRQHERPRQSR